jgi:TctA family transporter
MELIHNLSIGFGVAFTFTNLLYCLLGCILGTLIGVLPGIGPVATIAMLLPATYALPPVSALIMLAGIYYGAQYGGSTTAILVNLPGSRPRWSPASTATRWQGRAARDRRSPLRAWARSSRAAWAR